MRFKVSIFLFLFLLFHTHLYSQKIIIQEESQTIPSEELLLYCYDQAFFDFKVPVTKISSGIENGVDINLENTTCLYIDYGPYQTFFFAEPNKSYLINLPEIRDFSDDWKSTPYFKPSKYHLQVIEKGEPDKLSVLNENIRRFDIQFEPFVDKQLLRYYDPEFAQEKLDSFLLTPIIPKSISPIDYYQSYIFYKLGILKYNIKTHNIDELTEEFFAGKEICFQNPAYRDLFKLVYQACFTHLSDKENYADIFINLATKQYSQIESYLADIELFRQDVIFLNILLNEIYRAYYSINYDKKQLLELLRSIIQNASDSTILNTAQELEKTFISLETSYPVPEFELTNLHGNQIHIQDFQGKYVYIGFCNLIDLSCLREVEYLKLLYARQSENIEILYCIIGEENSDIESFIERNNIKWEIIPLKYDNKVLSDYKVMAFPVFYLIDKDGTLLKNPAPNPSENFELFFIEILRSRRNL
ncbi:MAG: TlpA family protein disulfide reductase [Bacteroidales bacterium]|nr:TlpA family protein disulfide reductase [Bacteroidales bacterium]